MKLSDEICLKLANALTADLQDEKKFQNALNITAGEDYLRLFVNYLKLFVISKII